MDKSGMTHGTAVLGNGEGSGPANDACADGGRCAAGGFGAKKVICSKGLHVRARAYSPDPDDLPYATADSLSSSGILEYGRVIVRPRLISSNQTRSMLGSR